MSREDSRDGDDLVEIGGPVDRATISLAISGEDLDPDEITTRLSCKPTRAHRQGEPVTNDQRGAFGRGVWLLKETGQTPIEPAELLRRLLRKLPTDQSTWDEINKRFEVQLRIAVHFTGWNKGYDLPADLLPVIARLGANLVHDLYAEEGQ